MAGGLALGTGEGVFSDFSVCFSVAGVDVGDFSAELLLAKVAVVAEEFPHGLAEEGEVVYPSF